MYLSTHPRDPSIHITPIVDNQMEKRMEKKMENEMETGVIKGLYRDPSIQIILHWALKSVNITYIGLFGSLGTSQAM